MSIKGMIQKLAGNPDVVAAIERLAGKRPLTTNEKAVIEQAKQESNSG